MRADLRHILRSLLRAPWYSTTVMGVIALGMALATTVFAVVDGVLFKPLGFPDAGRLYAVEPGFAGIAREAQGASVRDLADWTAAAPGVAFTGYWAAPWVGFGEGVNASTGGVARVLPNFFDVLGTRPLVGGFSAEDFDHQALVWPVIISDDVWQRRFQGESGVIGRTVVLDPSSGRGYRVVGVMPRGFRFPADNVEVSFITPQTVERESRRDVRSVVARVPPGMTTDLLRSRVEAGMAVTAAGLPPRGPKPPNDSDWSWRTAGPFDRAYVEPLASVLGRRSRPLFMAVFAAVSVLLALGGLNVSGLMAARWLDRAREVGVRRALGASAMSLGRLVLLEALVLILAGSLLGLALAGPFLRLGLTLLPEDILLLKAPGIDWRVAVFVAFGALVLATGTSIWPVRRALRVRSAAISGARESERTRSAGRFVVVTLQVAGAFVLTVLGSLLATSILSVYSHTPPIRLDGVVAIDVQVLGSRNERSPERTVRVESLVDRLRQVPGVTSVGATEAEILDGGNWPSWFAPPAGSGHARIDVDVQAVTRDYYRTVQPQLVAGRLPTDAELAGDAPVIVVSEALARAYWPHGSPLGETLDEGRPTEEGLTSFTVVGVVRDVRWWSWDQDTASIYAPYARVAHWPFVTFFIGTDGRTSRVMAEALRAIEETDGLVRPRRASTLADLFVDSVRPRRFQSWLFGSFAVAALVVVGVGILGLIAMATGRRTKEIGIRRALGASRPGIVGLLLREQFMSIGVGLAAGGLIAAWAVTLVKTYLYQVTVSDARVWAASAGVIVFIAAIGALIPALRASTTDPVNALRVD